MHRYVHTCIHGQSDKGENIASELNVSEDYQWHKVLFILANRDKKIKKKKGRREKEGRQREGEKKRRKQREKRGKGL